MLSINKGDLVPCQDPTCSLAVRCWAPFVLQLKDFRCAICLNYKYVEPNSNTLPNGYYTTCLGCDGQFKITSDTKSPICFICKENNSNTNQMIKSNPKINKIIYWSLNFKNLDDLLMNLSDLKINFENYEKINDPHLTLEYNNRGKFSYDYEALSGQPICVKVDNLFVSEKAILFGIIIDQLDMETLYRNKLMPHITLYKTDISAYEAGTLYSENYHNMNQKIPMKFRLVNMIGLPTNGFGMSYYMRIKVKLTGTIEPVYGQ